MFSKGNRLKSISAATNNCNLLSRSGCFAKRTRKTIYFRSSAKGPFPPLRPNVRSAKTANFHCWPNGCSD